MHIRHPGPSRKSLSLQLALLAALLSCIARVCAQGPAALPESALRAPWEQHLLVLQSMAVPITQSADQPLRRSLSDTLAALQVGLGEYETGVDHVIDRIIGDPQFSYVASEASDALARSLAEVHRQFDALYVTLQVAERADVRAAQASLEALRKTLEARRAFEADVYQALGSGSRQQIVDLATRWWKGEEQAIAVKKLVADYRQKVEGVAGGDPAR